MEKNQFANLEQFALDRDASVGGVPLDLGDGRVIYVRQAGGFHRRFEHISAMRIRAAGVNDLSDELDQRVAADEIAIAVAAECLVAGWDGLLGHDGKTVVYSTEAALELMQEYPDIAERVVAFAMDQENYRLRADTKSD